MKKLLLDTCTFIWLTCEPERLSEACKEAIENTESNIWVSDVNCFEICLKWQSKKLQLPDSPRIWFEEQTRLWCLQCNNLTRLHMYRASELSHHHKDPFDRLLVAQAKSDNFSILTPDSYINKYDVEVIW